MKHGCLFFQEIAPLKKQSATRILKLYYIYTKINIK